MIVATLAKHVEMMPDQIRAEILDLDARIAALDVEAKAPREQLSNIDRQKAKLTAERKALHARLDAGKEKPRVSDHAVIRYLEREYGFDFESVRNVLLTDTVRAAMKVGAEGVKMHGGTVKLRGNTVVTFVPN